MLLTPFVKFCWCRSLVVISWPVAWYRLTRIPCETTLTRDQLGQLIVDLQAVYDAFPEPDEAGMVQPAKAEHMPRVAAVHVDTLDLGVDEDEAWEVVALNESTT